MLGVAQGLVNIVLYGGIAIIFWYGPYLIRTECQNYSAGHWMVVCIQFSIQFLCSRTLYLDIYLLFNVYIWLS